MAFTIATTTVFCLVLLLACPAQLRPTDAADGAGGLALLRLQMDTKMANEVDQLKTMLFPTLPPVAAATAKPSVDVTTSASAEQLQRNTTPDPPPFVPNNRRPGQDGGFGGRNDAGPTAVTPSLSGAARFRAKVDTKLASDLTELKTLLFPTLAPAGTAKPDVAVVTTPAGAATLVVPPNKGSPDFVPSTPPRDRLAAFDTAPTSSAIVGAPAPQETDGQVSQDPEVNHRLTLEAQANVLSMGESTALGLTHAIVRPLVLVNNHISQAASSLPALLAANGAMLGGAIAAPIQAGTLLTNNIAAGLTGTLVSVPISLVSGGTAQLVGVVESGRELYKTQVAALADAVQQTMPYIARPVALVTGAHSMVHGMALNLASSGAQLAATGVQSVGAQLASTGQNIANVGSSLVLWGNGTSGTGQSQAEEQQVLVFVPAAEAISTELPPTIKIDPITSTKQTPTV